ncbi:monovalent cation/H+ antiporter complex subunit F [Cytophagaceae bacterium ABcell3]|nr:monovalent cation/H+ antiporter complex subunit F [Cytophagaceae bacterium ABcell3]
MNDFLIHYIALPLLSISVILVFVRVAIGPSLPDKVIALDLLVTISIGIIAAYSIIQDNMVFIDVALILALLAFLGTVAFAYYYEKRGKQ